MRDHENFERQCGMRVCVYSVGRLMELHQFGHVLVRRPRDDSDAGLSRMTVCPYSNNSSTHLVLRELVQLVHLALVVIPHRKGTPPSATARGRVQIDNDGKSAGVGVLFSRE